MAEIRRRTALYPGTFDPITDGHFDIIRRAATLFDRVIVAVADSPRKEPLFPLATRVDLVREACGSLAGVEVRSFTGLLAEEYQTLGIDVVVKGLRSVADFESEFQQAQANRKLNPQFETVFFLPSDRNMCVSSSVVREIFSLGGDVRDFVPENVRRMMAGLRARSGGGSS
jgi:pantetheine-phosphate adenylyltransferase